MSTTWTVLETFWSIEEAQMARAFLENEGIACQLEGVATAGTLWHLNNATGGVKLLVEADHAEQAGRLLSGVEEARRQRQEIGDESDFNDGDDASDDFEEDDLEDEDADSAALAYADTKEIDQVSTEDDSEERDEFDSRGNPEHLNSVVQFLWMILALLFAIGVAAIAM